MLSMKKLYIRLPWKLRNKEGENVMETKQKQIQIPVPVFNDMDKVLPYVDTLSMPLDVLDAYLRVMIVFKDKKEKMKRREAYTKLLFAANENDRHEARINYLKQSP